MPFRDWYLPTSPYDIGFDRWGSDWDDRAQMREANPRGGCDETHGVIPALGARGRNDEDAEREAA